jgi:hypothetical protein
MSVGEQLTGRLRAFLVTVVRRWQRGTRANQAEATAGATAARGRSVLRLCQPPVMELRQHEPVIRRAIPLIEPSPGERSALSRSTISRTNQPITGISVLSNSYINVRIKVLKSTSSKRKGARERRVRARPLPAGAANLPPGPNRIWHFAALALGQRPRRSKGRQR